MNDEFKKLQSALKERDDAPFRKTVDEHGGLVYQTALRRLNGDHALAQDAAQTAFADLAAKAAELPNDTVVPAWLYRQTCFITAKQVRAEVRRRQREAESAKQDHQEIEDPGHLWNEIKSLVDSAIANLGELDRTLLVLRFWNGKSLREAGEAAGISENAAQKRITRAFESMRGYLTKYGITGSVATLTLALSNNASAAAPAGLTAAITTKVLISPTPSTWELLNPTDWFIGLKAKPIIATGLSLMAIALGTTGFVAGRKAASMHHSATAWRDAVDEAAATAERVVDPESANTPNETAVTNQAIAIRRGMSVSELVARAAAAYKSGTTRSESWALAYVALRNLRATQIDEALRELERYRHEKEMFDELGPILTGILARTDHARAIAYAEDNFSGPPYANALREAIREWAKKDPPEVWARFNAITESGDLPISQLNWRGQANDIFAEWTAADPTAAFAELANVTTSQQRAALSGIAKAALGSTRRDEIVGLVNQMPDERQKRRLAEDLGGDWARINPAEAAAWAQTLTFENPAAHLEVLAEIAEEWFPTDPHNAGKWLISSSPEPLRAQVTEMVAEAFTKL